MLKCGIWQLEIKCVLFVILKGSEQNGNSLKAKYNQLVLDAKEKARQGQLEEALELFHRAYNIHKSTKLEKRIAKLKVFDNIFHNIVALIQNYFTLLYPLFGRPRRMIYYITVWL